MNPIEKYSRQLNTKKKQVEVYTRLIFELENNVQNFERLRQNFLLKRKQIRAQQKIEELENIIKQLEDQKK